MTGRDKEWWKAVAFFSIAIAFVLMIAAVGVLIAFNQNTIERREESSRLLCAVPGENVEYCKKREVARSPAS